MHLRYVDEAEQAPWKELTSLRIASPSLPRASASCTWATKLKEERELCDAPVLAKLKGSLDPDRAILALAGKTRASTLNSSPPTDAGVAKHGPPPGSTSRLGGLYHG